MNEAALGEHRFNVSFTTEGGFDKSVEENAYICDFCQRVGLLPKHSVGLVMQWREWVGPHSPRLNQAHERKSYFSLRPAAERAQISRKRAHGRREP